MFKKLALGAALLLAPTVASAYTVTSNTLSGQTLQGATVTYYDTGAEAVSLTDLTAKNSIATIMLENAGYADSNAFGIYGFTKDSSGNIVLGNTLEVFAGPRSTVYFPAATLQWSVDSSNQWWVKNIETGATSSIGTTFGFYIDANGTDRYYSQSSLNPNDVDLFKIYNVFNNPIGITSDVVVAIEDVPGGDGDYNDMVVGVNDVAPVPEPGTMMLLGAGFLGLAIYGKRRKNA